MEKHVVTLLGEKDHGKSTLIGNLMIATGSTSEYRINEAKKYSKGGRFEPGYILDSFVEEREQEMTIDTTRAEMVYKGDLFELIDVPGHLELIKNMMSGASNGEIAVLMVSMKEGEGLTAQTKRHVYVSGMLGVNALVVAINKMDLVGFSEVEFKKMKEKISAYLESVSFSRPVVYVPVSAYGSDNLVRLSNNMEWYKGKPLIDELAALCARKSKSASKGGLRAIVQDVIEQDGKDMVFCMVSSGSLKKGENVVVQPSGKAAKISELYLKGESAPSARSGSNVAIVLEGEAEVKRGFVISGAQEKPHSTKRFKALVFFISSVPANASTEVKMNNNGVSARISKLHEIISPVTGKSSGPSKIIPAWSAAKVEIELAEDYPVERFEDYNELGRFALYSSKKFCGIGIVI